MTMTKDVVCGMGVDQTAPDSFVKIYRGRRYYFCCPGCLELFTKEPDVYLHRSMESLGKVLDPICGMTVDVKNPPYTTVYDGATVYFCSLACKIEYDQDPSRYS